MARIRKKIRLPNFPSDEQKTAQTAENAARTKPKAQPMGKQEMPDIFKQQ